MPDQSNQNNQTNPQITDLQQPVITPPVDDNVPVAIPDFQVADTPDIQTIPEDIGQVTDPVNQSTNQPISDIGTSAPMDDPTMMVSAPPKKKFGGGKIIATILGFLVLVGGIAGGVILTQQNQQISEKASNGYREEWKCPDDDGQGYRWCLIATVDCPNDSGGPINCNSVDWDDSNTCTRESEPCTGGGGGGGDNPPNPQCEQIKAYDTNWSNLSAVQLTQLKTGDKVRFAVKGTAQNYVEAARFTINGTQSPEVTSKKPGTDEFYYEYTIPAGTTTFNVSGQVRYPVVGWK